MVQKRTLLDIVADTVIYTFLSIIMIVMLLPFINAIASSLAINSEILQSKFLLFPKKITFEAYKYIFFYNNTTTRALLVSGGVTIVGTTINILLTTLTAYALSIKYFYGRKYLLAAIIFTMLFSPGMIANYFTIRGYGLLNNYLALILPRAINVFYLLLMKNFFQEIPSELTEAATIDGCSLYSVFVKIIMPLSKPAVATFTLFYAVDHWNSFFDALIYMTDPDKWPITILLRQVILMAQSSASEDIVISPVSMRMATIVVAILPIIGIYPFLQKYFQSGIMIGSIKG